MNVFKQLDQFFPCGKDRLSGEVVSLQINLPEGGSIHWKRKAWYVNASVNAWHLHRGLCRDLTGSPFGRLCNQSQLRTLKRALAYWTMFAYLKNAQTGEQYLEINLKDYLWNVDRGPTVVLDDITMMLFSAQWVTMPGAPRKPPLEWQLFDYQWCSLEGI